MSRKRRRHADPAAAPRRPPEDRLREERRAAAQREVARVHASLARLVAVLLAAAVYFGVAAANAIFEIFPRSRSFDLGDPQLLVGIAAILASLALPGWLGRALGTRALLQLAAVVTAAYGGLAIAVILSVGALSPEAAAEILVILLGIGVVWIAGTLWLMFLGRRLGRLRERSS
jgi:hypothetical protein